MDLNIRPMTIEDYDNVYALWKSIKGFAMRSMDDSYKGVKKFLDRNPGISVVAEAEGKIVGAILCGHDGRCARFYHVCVHESFRQFGIGKLMVENILEKLREEEISVVSIIAFKQNEVGNTFWKKLGWTERSDLNEYDYVINTDNTITRNK